MRAQLHRDLAGRAAVDPRERVVDRVLHELVEHHRERGGEIAGQHAGVALDRQAQVAVGAGDGLGDHPHERLHDVVEAHLVARLARQRLVHDRDRADPPLRLLDRLLRLG